MSAWRVYVVVAVCCFAASCGGGDGGDAHVGDAHVGDAIQRGFFIGKNASGEPISLAVGTIRSVFFRCDDIAIFQGFHPAEPVAADGSFAVDVLMDGHVIFTVAGRFVSDDRIDGTISGSGPCLGSFVATRCDPATQACDDADGDAIPDELDAPPVPSATPTLTRRPSATPTRTVARATRTPTPTPTTTPIDDCGNGEIDGDEECDGTDLDDNTCFDLCEQDDEGGTLRCRSDCTYDFSGCLSQDCEAF